VDLTLRALDRVNDWPDSMMQEHAEVLRRRAPDLKATMQRLAAAAEGNAWQTRVHGDFHLGQVLVTHGDATLIDFEGEPAKTMEQRRAKSSPLRDVAGLLRSFDYASATASDGRVAESEAAGTRRAMLAENFRSNASRTFLEAYRAVLQEAPRPWVAPEAERGLLDLFLLEKAAYEVRYEAANRPAWLGIPLGGLVRLMDRLLPLEVA